MPRTVARYAETFPLSVPFRISRGTKTAAEVVTVEIRQDGVVGRGECVPYPRYGETIDTTIRTIDAALPAIEEGIGRDALMRLMPAGAARNAVDCALWDLEARLAAADVPAMLGLERPLPPIPTAMTISLDTPENMGAAAAALAGVPLIKVKVDRNAPAAQLRAVRKSAPRPRMIVDPNESWTIDDVSAWQSLLIELGVDLLEQPLPAAGDGALIGYASAIPIAADESVHGVDDLALLPDGYDVVNIKLDKTGGLTAALALADAARKRGLGVMTGCMVCSSLSIAPALMIAAQSIFVDLDGPTWLTQDRESGLEFRQGWLTAPQSFMWGG